MLEVLGRSTSINVRKVLWCCDELGIACRNEPYGLPELPLTTPGFLALNPNAMVPVLRDGDFVLWESNAICRYLAATHGRADLLPADARGRAVVERWMDWQISELNPAWGYAYMALVRKAPDHDDAAAIAKSAGRWNQKMAILDGQLARTGAYVVGADFTLADIVIGLSMHRWQMTPIARADLPAVAAYRERLETRAGFRRWASAATP